MDSSLQSANLTTEELDKSVDAHDMVHGEGDEPHIHLPNPSLWPLLLSAAVIMTLTGLLFIPSNPWITIVAAPLVVVGILGWALEDPMAPLKGHFETIVARGVPSRFEIGQEVIDKEGVYLGKVQARFSDNYILVERGGLFVKTYYVPQSAARSNLKKNIAQLSLSEDELVSKGMTAVPEDLYDAVPEYAAPKTTGVAQFARGPLSPAETGHYNYGPNFPGINTDASGSYYPDEVRPIPQKYVGERRRVYATARNIPPRATNPE